MLVKGLDFSLRMSHCKWRTLSLAGQTGCVCTQTTNQSWTEQQTDGQTHSRTSPLQTQVCLRAGYSLDNVFVFVLPRPRQLRPHSLTEVTSLHQCHTSFLRKPNSESNLVYIWQMADPEFLVGSLIFMKSKGKHF